jgi:hypothetical protein
VKTIKGLLIIENFKELAFGQGDNEQKKSFCTNAALQNVAKAGNLCLSIRWL